MFIMFIVIYGYHYALKFDTHQTWIIFIFTIERRQNIMFVVQRNYTVKQVVITIIVQAQRDNDVGLIYQPQYVHVSDILDACLIRNVPAIYSPRE